MINPGTCPLAIPTQGVAPASRQPHHDFADPPVLGWVQVQPDNVELLDLTNSGSADSLNPASGAASGRMPSRSGWWDARGSRHARQRADAVRVAE